MPIFGNMMTNRHLGTDEAVRFLFRNVTLLGHHQNLRVAANVHLAVSAVATISCHITFAVQVYL